MERPQLTEADWGHLQRCIGLAEQALAAGDEPFGSVLVAADGTRLCEDRNRVVSTGDSTRHPEFTLGPLGRDPDDRRGPGEVELTRFGGHPDLGRSA